MIKRMVRFHIFNSADFVMETEMALLKFGYSEHIIKVLNRLLANSLKVQRRKSAKFLTLKAHFVTMVEKYNTI